MIFSTKNESFTIQRKGFSYKRDSVSQYFSSKPDVSDELGLLLTQ